MKRLSGVCLFLSVFCFAVKGNIPTVHLLPVDSLTVPLSMPVVARFFDGKLFVVDAGGGFSGFIKVVDTKNNKILFAFAKFIGIGANKYSQVTSIDIYKDGAKSMVGVFDPISGLYKQYDYDRLCKKKAKTKPVAHKFQTNFLLHEVFKLDSFYLATGLTEKGKFILIPFDSLKENRFQGKYRPKPQKTIPERVNVRANLGRIFLSPSRNLVGNVIYLAGVVEVFNVSVDGSITPKWEYIINELDYKHTGYSTITCKSVMGYLSGAMTQQYIYTLYSGRKEEPIIAEGDKEERGMAAYGNEIHMFDYNGNLIKKIEIQRSAFGICIDTAKKQLYAIVHNPKPSILVYQLDEE